MIWQGRMVQKSSGDPKIGRSNNKNLKISGVPPRTPLWGLTVPPNPTTVLFLSSLTFRSSRNYYYYHKPLLRHCMPSRRSFTTLPTEHRALNGRGGPSGPWVPNVMSGRNMSVMIPLKKFAYIYILHLMAAYEPLVRNLENIWYGVYGIILRAGP